MKTLKRSLLFLWCLPQNILGLLVLAFTKFQRAKTERYEDTFVTRWKYGSGVSLGCFIFISEHANHKTLRHEYGHFLDGNCLGPLYLPIIFLPSFCWAAFFDKYREKHNISYYTFYTERRADKLGGVNRQQSVLKNN